MFHDPQPLMFVNSFTINYKASIPCLVLGFWVKITIYEQRLNIKFLAHLFRRKSRANVITRSSSLSLASSSVSSSSCKTFNVAKYPNRIKGINTKLNLEHLLIMTRCICKTRVGITMKAIILELCPFLTKHFKQNDKWALVSHAVLF